MTPTEQPTRACGSEVLRKHTLLKLCVPPPETGFRRFDIQSHRVEDSWILGQ